jgi:hypothetical protein
LETETSVSEDLPCNISCCRNFHASTDHFEWTPVLVSHKVSDEFFACVIVELVGGIGYSCAESDKFLSIVNALISKFFCWL